MNILLFLTESFNNFGETTYNIASYFGGTTYNIASYFGGTTYNIASYFGETTYNIARSACMSLNSLVVRVDMYFFPADENALPYYYDVTQRLYNRLAISNLTLEHLGTEARRAEVERMESYVRRFIEDPNRPPNPFRPHHPNDVNNPTDPHYNGYSAPLYSDYDYAHLYSRYEEAVFRRERAAIIRTFEPLIQEALQVAPVEVPEATGVTARYQSYLRNWGIPELTILPELRAASNTPRPMLPEVPEEADAVDIVGLVITPTLYERQDILDHLNDNYRDLNNKVEWNYRITSERDRTLHLYVNLGHFIHYTLNKPILVTRMLDEVPDDSLHCLYDYITLELNKPDEILETLINITPNSGLRRVGFIDPGTSNFGYALSHISRRGAFFMELLPEDEIEQFRVFVFNYLNKKYGN